MVKAGRVARHHNDRLIGPALLDDGCQLIPIHSRHGIIRQDQVESIVLELGQRSFAAVRRLDFVPVKRQEHLEHFAHSGIIVHHQNLISSVF